MQPLLVITGLPGSGKSHRVGELRLRGYRAFDDYHENARDGDPAFTMSRHYEALRRALHAGEPCVIADRAYCEAGRRERLEREAREAIPGVELRWEFFANDPDACAANVMTRPRAGKNPEEELRFIREGMHHYLIPAGATCLNVWRRSST